MHKSGLQFTVEHIAKLEEQRHVAIRENFVQLSP